MTSTSVNSATGLTESLAKKAKTKSKGKKSGSGSSKGKPSKKKIVANKKKKRVKDVSEKLDKADNSSDIVKSVEKKLSRQKQPQLQTYQIRNGSHSLTKRQLLEYQSFLEAVSNSRTDRDILSHMNRMSDTDFQLMLDCLDRFANIEDTSNGILTEQEARYLQRVITPHQSTLKRFVNPKIALRTKRRMLGRKQKGGSAILAAVIGGLLPMAVNAISQLISSFSSKKKK